LIAELRQVINEAYARAWLAAGEILDG